MTRETTEREVKDDGKPVEMPSTITPQEFYAAMTKRADVSELMHRLARWHCHGRVPAGSNDSL